MGCSNKDKVVDHTGKEFDSYVDMCLHYNVDYDTFHYRRRRGLSLEECLTSGEYACIDHEGRGFGSVSEMCRYHGVNRDTFITRQKRGLPLEECLSSGGRRACHDHEGREFKTMRDMCEFHGVNYKTFLTRRRGGYSLRDCLYPLRKTRMSARIIEGVASELRESHEEVDSAKIDELLETAKQMVGMAQLLLKSADSLVGVVSSITGKAHTDGNNE